MRTKRIEPRNPPASVINSLDARFALYSCIEAATMITKVSERRSEVLELTALINTKIIFNLNFQCIVKFLTHFEFFKPFLKILFI